MLSLTVQRCIDLERVLALGDDGQPEEEEQEGNHQENNNHEDGSRTFLSRGLSSPAKGSAGVEGDAEINAAAMRVMECLGSEAALGRPERHLVTVVLHKDTDTGSFGLDVGPNDGPLSAHSAFAVRTIQPGVSKAA